MDWYVAHYILNKGIEYIKELTDEQVEEAVSEIKAIEDAGKHPVFSSGFVREIITQARMLCNKEDAAISFIKKVLKNTTY